MARPIVMPSFGMYTAEGTLLSWLEAAGASVEAGDPIVEIETEKSIQIVEAPATGILHPVALAGSNLVVEALIGYILAPGEEPPLLHSDIATSIPGPEASPWPEGSRIAFRQSPSSGQVNSTAGELRASPIARRLASEHGIDLTQIKGTGPGGRIVESDVVEAVQQQEVRAQRETSLTLLKILRRVPLTGLRRTIAGRLRQTLNTAASLTLTRQVPADFLVKARSTLTERMGETLSYDALFIKLLAVALRRNLDMNATLENDEILIWDEIHIGFAVPVAGGLVVPVVRNADSVTLAEIAGQVRALRKRAGSGQITLEEMKGGTATLTNLGAYGVDAFTPILNPPQSAILGIGRILEQPVIAEGRVVAGRTCTLSLTFDHRVVDGVPAAQLLEGIAQHMIDLKYLLSLS
jgi:pyruvate dehydrogenase E2 component (dihydrolipoamide acetyltransferase)